MLPSRTAAEQALCHQHVKMPVDHEVRFFSRRFIAQWYQQLPCCWYLQRQVVI